MQKIPFGVIGRIGLGLAVACAAAWFVAPHPADTEVPVAGKSEELIELLTSNDPWIQLTRNATFGALDKKYYEEGADFSFECFEYGPVSVLIHSDTDPERYDEIMQQIIDYYASQNVSSKSNYWTAGRWTQTATDATTGSTGNPITLTWNYVPDGLMISGGVGEPASPSDLVAVFSSVFTNPNAWKGKIRDTFKRWDRVLGTTYIKIAEDDSANFGNFPGQLGIRADVRIGGHPIDGTNGILAYNSFPNGGDMVLDTDDVFGYNNPINDFRFLKNVVAHEHGHGMGLGHVIPVTATKLMEPSTSGVPPFLGPQDDDIRGGQRNYGDPLENNDDVATASLLGALAEPDEYFFDTLSINRGSDQDFYSVDLSNSDVTIEVVPMGSTYDLGIQGGSTSPISTNMISDPDIELYDAAGTTLLASATSGGVGDTEILNAPLPYVGTYIIKVFRKLGTGADIQRYSLRITPTGSPTSVADNGVPVRSALEVSVAPNPFNPLTKVRFYMAAAGAYEVDVFDISGRKVRSLGGRSANQGQVDVSWDGTEDNGAPAASGVYLMKVTADGQTEVKRATLVR